MAWFNRRGPAAVEFPDLQVIAGKTGLTPDPSADSPYLCHNGEPGGGRAQFTIVSTSLALGPTDFNERETTHFGWFRHAAAKACSSATHSGASSSQSRITSYT